MEKILRQQALLARGLVAMLCIVSFSGCASQVKVTMTEDELKQQVQKNYPQEKTLEIASQKLDILMEKPDVELVSGRDRLRLKIPLSSEPVGFLPRLSGSITVSGDLSYEYTEYTFYLKDIEVEEIAFPLSDLFPSGGGALTEELTAQAKNHLVALPLRKLDPKELKELTGRYVLKSARVKGKKLELTLALPD